LLREGDGEKKDAEPGPPQPQLERLHLQALQTEPRAGVEQKDALGPRRRRADPTGRVQPAGGPAAGELVLGLAALAFLGELKRGEQQLLHAPLDRAQRQALLHQPVGKALVEAVERLDQAGGGADALAALAGDLDRRRDVVSLEQCAPQSLELPKLVLAVPAGGPARSRIAEAPLPASEGVRADAEELGRRVGSNAAHLVSPQVFGRIAIGLEAFRSASPPQAAQTLQRLTGFVTARHPSAQHLNAILHR